MIIKGNKPLCQKRKMPIRNMNRICYKLQYKQIKEKKKTTKNTIRKGSTGRNTDIGIVQYKFCFQVVLEGLYGVVVQNELLKLFVCVLFIRPVLPTLHALALNRSGKQKVSQPCQVSMTTHNSRHKTAQRAQWPTKNTPKTMSSIPPQKLKGA